MRMIVGLSLLLCTTVFSVEAAPNTNDTAVALAGRIVDALAQDDVKSAQANWLTVEQLRAFLANPPEGSGLSEIDDRALVHVTAQWSKCDKEIESRLRALLDELKRRGLDLSKIKLLKATPKRLTSENGLASAQQLEIVMAIGEITIEYSFGGAALYGARWRCVELCGGGATLIKNDKAESIRCETPRTPDAGDGP